MTFAEHGLSVCHSCCRLVLNFIFPVFGFRFSLKKEIENSAHKTLARKHSAKKNLKPKCIPLDQLRLRHCLSSPPNLAKGPPLGLGMSRQSLASSSSASSPSSRTLSMNNACEDCWKKNIQQRCHFLLQMQGLTLKWTEGRTSASANVVGYPSRMYPR